MRRITGGLFMLSAAICCHAILTAIAAENATTNNNLGIAIYVVGAVALVCFVTGLIFGLERNKD